MENTYLPLNKDHHNWKVVIAKSFKESQVFKNLISLGIETYLPLNRFLMFWGEKQKWIIKPIFPGIIFARFDNDKEPDILSIPFARAIMSRGKTHVEIPGEHVHFIKKVIGLNENFEIKKFKISKGQKIDIVDGPLRKMDVKIIKYAGQEKAAVTIPKINFTILLDTNSRLFKYEEQKEYYEKIWNF